MNNDRQDRNWNPGPLNLLTGALFTELCGASIGTVLTIIFLRPPLNGAHFAHPRKSASARFSPVSWRRNNKWNIRYRRNNNSQYVTNFLQVSTQVEFWPQTTFPLRIWVEDCIEWFENIGDNAKVWISSRVQLYRGTDIQTMVWHQDCNELFFLTRQDLIMPVGLHHFEIIMSFFFS